VKYPMKKLVFDVSFAGERAAGLHSFTETVTITFDAGEPKESAEDLAQMLQSTLADYYEGADVTERA
jgi:hypothetical protein